MKCDKNDDYDDEDNVEWDCYPDKEKIPHAIEDVHAERPVK